MKLTVEQVQKARKLRSEGVAFKDIAALFGVSVSGVHYRLKDKHPRASQAKPRRLTDDEIRAIRRLRIDGASASEIGRMFDVNSGTVTHHTRDLIPQPAKPPTRDELLLSAYPWAWTLTVEERAEFAEELSHPHKYMQEREIDLLVIRWRVVAQDERRRA